MATEVTRDRVKGMLTGHFMGDALGAPYEFWKWNKDRIYSGKLNIDLFRKRVMFNRGEEIRYPPGSVTDDSQMTIALINALIKKRKWDRETVVLSYCKWSHTNNTGMGRNTAFIFGNRSMKGYESKVEKMEELIKKGEQPSLANGSLMRCSPLCIFDNDKYIVKDTKLSNPYKQNIQASKVYYQVLHSLLLGKTNVREIITNCLEWITDKDLKTCIQQALNREIRDVVKQKGWVLHALWCSLVGILFAIENKSSYRSVMKWTITQGGNKGVGDTDTNAAITGALVGAYYGWDELNKHHRFRSNWEILTKTANKNKTNLKEFLPTDIDELVDGLMDLI